MKRKTFIAVLLLFAFSAGCNISSHPLHSSTPTLEVFADALIETPMQTATSSPPFILQQEIISPQVMSICSETQEVSFEELDFPHNLRLFLMQNTFNGFHPVPSKLLSIAPNNSIPTPVITDELLEYTVSPNHKWISFERLNDDNQRYVLWVSSLDGTEQWPVIELNNENYTGYASWISDQEIFIIGSPNETDLSMLDIWDFMPFIGVNPFTFEQRQITYLARPPQDGLYYYGGVSIDGHSFGMYGSLNMVDFLYDFEEDKALPVFSWLDVLEPFDTQPIKPIWTYSDGKFAVAILRPNGIDLAFNLDIQTITENKQYAEVMKKIVLPEHLLSASMLGIVPAKYQIVFQTLNFLHPSQGENWIYLFDYDKQIVVDYCFDLQDSLIGTKFSPDGRFVAFSLEDFNAELTQDQHYVVILDLENGHVAYIRGYTLVDWGIE